MIYQTIIKVIALITVFVNDHQNIFFFVFKYLRLKIIKDRLALLSLRSHEFSQFNFDNILDLSGKNARAIYFVILVDIIENQVTFINDTLI